MREFSVRIQEDAFDALLHLAVRERRAPSAQAAVLLEQQLRGLVGAKAAEPTEERIRRRLPAGAGAAS